MMAVSMTSKKSHKASRASERGNSLKKPVLDPSPERARIATDALWSERGQNWDKNAI